MNNLLQHLWTTSWQVCILGAIVYFVCFLFRNSSPKIRYWLWLIVLLRLFIPDSPILTNFTSYSVKIQAPDFVVEDRIAQQNVGVEVAGKKFLQQKVAINWAESFFHFWMIGFLLFMLLALFRLGQVVYCLRKCTPVDNPDIKNLVSDLCETFAISRKVRIYSNPDCRILQGPCVVGFYCPKIIIPQHMLSEWSVEELQPIILHELAHIKRYDLIFTWLQTIVQILYFFHPVIWYMNRKIYQERELICDDLAVTYSGNCQTSYAKTLLGAIEVSQPKVLLTLLVLNLAEENFLVQRIKRMMNANYTSNIPIKKAYFLMLVLIAIFSLSLLGEKNKEDTKVAVIDPDKHIYQISFGISEEQLSQRLGKKNGRFDTGDEVGVLYGKYYLFLFRNGKLSGVKTDPYSIVRWHLVDQLAKNDFLKDKRFWALKNGIRQGYTQEQILQILGKKARKNIDKIFYSTDKAVVTFVMHRGKARGMYIKIN